MQRSIFRKSVVTASTLALLMSAGMLVAGPLNPPAGPVQSSMKPLSEIEPRIALSQANTPGDADSVFRITQPGSYYLTGNMTVAAAKAGIEVDASNVTIDLNGFTITGQSGSLDGISNAGSARAVTVKNGVVESMGQGGVDLFYSNPQGAQNCLIEGVIARNNVKDGIRVNDGVARSCQASGNVGSGIVAYLSYDSAVESCVTTSNQGSGISISLGTVTDCSSTGNTNSGINCGSGTVSKCQARANSTGISGGSVSVLDCNVWQCGLGIVVFYSGLIRGNTISDVAVGSTTGIRIHTKDGVRIEGNNIVRYGIGIELMTANNLVIGNSFRGCTTAVLAVAANRVGTIVTGASSAAINGSGGGGLGITDPYANIVY